MSRTVMFGESWRTWWACSVGRKSRRNRRVGCCRSAAWIAAERLEARTLLAASAVNHAPTDLVLANGYVVENSLAGTLVGTFGTADPDAGETFTYRLLGGVPHLFRVEGNQLLSRGEFDFETRDRYELLVRSTDSRGASVSRWVTIQVMDRLEDEPNLSVPLLITRPHREIPPSDSVANGYSIGTSGIAGSEVVFSSPAPNLVPGDTNGLTDIFVASKDGKKERISVASNGQQANGDSVGAKISRDGRFVAFVSWATNLFADDSNERGDAFVRDRVSGTTKRINLRKDGQQFSEGSVTEVAISANGRFVAFVVETASCFQNNEGGLYVRDLRLGTTKRLIATPDGEAFPNSISISGDGRRIAYLVHENNVNQVRMVDRLSGAIQLVSASRFGTVRPEYSGAPMISENGRFVVFESQAAGLVEGGEHMREGVFIRDLLKNTIRRVDVGFDGSDPYDMADSPSISADGRFVAFRSLASNLTPDSGPGYFIRDLRTGQTQPLTVTLDGSQLPGPERITPLVSGDGRYVAFSHFASNLVPRDGNGGEDLFLRDTRTNTTELVTRRDPELPSTTSISRYDIVGAVSLSADGTQVFFASSSVTLTPGLTRNSPYEFTQRLFTRELNSPTDDIEHLPVRTYFSTAVSRNGRFVLFITEDSLAPTDTTSYYDLYVFDRETGNYTQANIGSDGSNSQWDGYPVAPNALSDDGRYVVFTSSASGVVTGDTNGKRDIFVRDLLLGTTARVSVASDGTESNGWSGNASVSSDGRFVVFESEADNLVPSDQNRTSDIFVRDLLNGTTERVSVNSEGQEGSSYSYSPLISGDGSCIVFMGYSTNLVAGVGYSGNIFWHDRLTGTTQPVIGTYGWGYLSSISNDGRLVAFHSDEMNMVPDDTNQSSDVFVRDMQRGVTRRVSVNAEGEQLNAGSSNGILSGDGTKLVFSSSATNLVPHDFNGNVDLFWVDLASIPELVRYSIKAESSQVSEAGASSVSFVFERVGSLDSPATIPFLVSGTASSLSDFRVSGADSFAGSTGTITFAAGQDQVVVEITPIDDGLVEPTETVEFTLSRNVPSIASGQQASVTIEDNDFARFSVTPFDFAGSVTESGSTLKFFVVLDAQPSSNVVLEVINGDQTEIQLLTSLLIFTPQNWNVPQSVTVRGVDDRLADGEQRTVVFVQIHSRTTDPLFVAAAFESFTMIETLDNESRR